MAALQNSIGLKMTVGETRGLCRNSNALSMILMFLLACSKGLEVIAGDIVGRYP